MRHRFTLALLALLSLAGCATLSPPQRDAAVGIAHAARSTQVDCNREDACALPSPLMDAARETMAASTPEAPRHNALILDNAPDALLARIHLIRSARHSIDLQTYIFDEDDSAQLVLDELQAAAFRGVRVRVLLDQLAALKQLDTLAAYSALHANFELRVYNPVLDRGRLSLPMYAVAAACCWGQLNRRMHNKLLLVDGIAAITGGRNYQDDYYDWDAHFNFRDRDLLLTGPALRDMAVNFEAFWNSRRSVPAEQLGDVARHLLKNGPPPPPHHPYRKPERVRALLADVADPQVLRERFITPALAVQNVQFIADFPVKHRLDAPAKNHVPVRTDAASTRLMELIAGAREDVLLQTPYLVLSRQAQRTFRHLHKQDAPPRVRVSTNSLAATDAFITYAMSYKYKRRYLHKFGFEIHEFKPFPADAPFEFGITGADLPELDADEPAQPARRSLRQRLLALRGLDSEPESEAGRRSPFGSAGGMPVRLKRAGIRMGLHAKSLVVDGRVGVVGTHNFDPRGDTLNTESAVVIEDPAFARALATSIRRDMAPGNAWTIARRDRPPVLSGLEYSLGKISERLPIFDLWPIKYATSYEYAPGPDCPPGEPPSPFSPHFRACHKPVGDFPEVDMGLKRLGVRVFTGFGSGLSPIL
ncbi:MAG: phospholipase D family protein [Thermomonas sp.]|uniref:phospholipase D family protein n=1 Tax=Thermomonas sp. TaxID=1971895 RepID=UPI0039E2554E